jgi:hypothetical protein
MRLPIIKPLLLPTLKGFLDIQLLCMLLKTGSLKKPSLKVSQLHSPGPRKLLLVAV